MANFETSAEAELRFQELCVQLELEWKTCRFCGEAWRGGHRCAAGIFIDKKLDDMSKEKPRTVSPPTGQVSAEFKLRVCGEHLYPVGLISGTSREQFVCLLKFHRMEIEETRVIDSNLTQLLPAQMAERIK